MMNEGPMRFHPLPTPPQRPGNSFARGFVSGALTEPSHGETSTAEDPFQLIEDIDTEGNPSIGFVVGKIGNSIPTLDSVPLDGDNPRHVLDSTGDFKAWLQVNISLAADNFHPKIDDAEITVEDAGANPDREDFKVEWEDDENKISGAFFILIADLTVTQVPGSDPPVNAITSKDQWLKTSYRSIVMVAEKEDEDQFDTIIAFG